VARVVLARDHGWPALQPWSLTHVQGSSDELRRSHQLGCAGAVCDRSLGRAAYTGDGLNPGCLKQFGFVIREAT
jgi:hypothetical protein